MEVTYIFGHKKPDTDSVVASIALSYLKNKLGGNATPRLLGSVNKETKFVLDYFGFKEPKYLNDVKVEIKDMLYKTNAYINENSSIYDAFNMMQNLSVTGLPIVNENRLLVGYTNLKEIAKFLIKGDIYNIHSNYNNIVKVVEGEEVLKFDREITGSLITAAYSSSTFTSEIKLDNNSILVVGDRQNIIAYAIDTKVKLIVVVGGSSIKADLLTKAAKNKVNIIFTKNNTYTTINKIKLANYVKFINTNENPITFGYSDTRDDFIDAANHFGHTNYPVVTKENKCVGMLRLVDANNFKKKKVILVDHNELEQSVDGLEQAEILEIIDHHKLGTIGTNNPINFRSMPVGCTNTIIYKLFQESNIPIPKELAGIMLSAILSDTLMLKSPTTTKIDREVASTLSLICEQDINTLGMQIFKAGSSIKGLSANEIIYSDFKEFKHDDEKIGIGQITTLDIEEILEQKEEYLQELNKMEQNGYKLALLFITDIINNGSYLLYNNKGESIIKNAYNLSNIEEGVYLKGIVSRKKQMVPPILDYLEK